MSDKRHKDVTVIDRIEDVQTSDDKTVRIVTCTHKDDIRAIEISRENLLEILIRLLL
jgi:hypothetical protein